MNSESPILDQDDDLDDLIDADIIKKEKLVIKP